MDRRTVLGAGAAALLGLAVSGCGQTTPGSTEPAGVLVDDVPVAAGLLVDSSDDLDLAGRALADEQDLESVYRDVQRANPGLRGRINPLLRFQHAHAALLASVLPDSGDLTGRSPGPGAARDATPDRLRRQAAAAADRRLADAVAADSGALARALASMAACHAVTAADWTSGE